LYYFPGGSLSYQIFSATASLSRSALDFSLCFSQSQLFPEVRYVFPGFFLFRPAEIFAPAFQRVFYLGPADQPVASAFTINRRDSPIVDFP